ncbi:hypothetical protein BDD14_1840 [Edaphobacter modestus]|uniref:Uncharacterized protein n=1 Tax=Edaphobacter modestus TaxID=388466 RepID=A0A4V2G4C2_9BACT|nr:hypothetical protein BDD14_1840 [Edaphobacter modestus]
MRLFLAAGETRATIGRSPTGRIDRKATKRGLETHSRTIAVNTQTTNKAAAMTTSHQRLLFIEVKL